MIAFVGFMATANAQFLVAKTGSICVDVKARWIDLAGDNWVLEGLVPRPARGFRYEIVDAVGSQFGWLGEVDGCVAGVFVQVDPADPTIEVRIKSKARINGVDLESWQGPDVNSSNQLVTAVFTPSTGSGSTFDFTGNAALVVTGQDQRFLNLLVGTMVFRFYDWNVNEGNTRDCCLEGTLANPHQYNLDGTCGPAAPPGFPYARITTPIQLQADDAPGAGCCGSTLIDGDTNLTNDPPGLHVPLDEHKKFNIAHELGHVIGEMRTGAKEWGQYPLLVDYDGCNGDYTSGGAPIDELDRGHFRKITMAQTMREAWGDFVAM